MFFRTDSQVENIVWKFGHGSFVGGGKVGEEKALAYLIYFIDLLNI